MSLFLNESASFTATAQVPYDQAMLGLMENISDLATLTEASLHADFTLRQQAEILTEAESDSAQAGFFARLGAHIKAMYLKAKARLLAFWESLKARVKGLWNRLFGKAQAATKSELQVPKSAPKALENSIKGLEKLGGLVAGDIEKADYKTKFLEARDEFDATNKKLGEMVAAEQKAKQLVEISVNELNAARDFADKAAATAGKQIAEMTQLQKEHEQAVADVAKARTKDDNKAAKQAAAGKAVSAGESKSDRKLADDIAKQKSSRLTAAISVANGFASAAVMTASLVAGITAKAHAGGNAVAV